jgi:putative flavoprotein involved in K+ transport
VSATDVDVVVVGAGQAGLSISRVLSELGREHLVLERGRAGQSWRDRWDSFTLVLPNWTIRLAGQAYDGPDPDGFMPRDEFVEYVASYATSGGAPVREGVEALALGWRDGRFALETSAGEFRAREVVVATGGYQRPHRPAGVRELEALLPVIDAGQYRSPGQLPSGRVLVVGSGQSGCQIAEELKRDGREVVLSCGRAPGGPRRIGGRDIFWWVAESRFMRMTLEDLPNPMARLAPNPQSSGLRGGHDLHYRTLQAMGVILVGHLLGARAGWLEFAADLTDSVDFGDARYRDLQKLVAEAAAERGLPVPSLPEPAPFHADAPGRFETAAFGAVVCTSGFRPDYTRWIDFPEAFDETGFPIQNQGSSSRVPGLHFMGVPFQRSRASATLYGVGHDAEVLGASLAGAARA